MNADGSRAQPFWSSRPRVERIIKNVPAFAGFHPVQVSWLEFCRKWVAELAKDNVKVGVNWSGPRATGYDVAAAQVVLYVEAIANRVEP